PGGSSPSSPRPSVDLPQPDSPTSPSVSPGHRSKLTPSTARTGPDSVPYQTRRSRTVSTGPDGGGPAAGPRTGRVSTLLGLDGWVIGSPHRPLRATGAGSSPAA